MAAGTECAAILDVLAARGLVVRSRHGHARSLIVRVIQMLTRLTERPAVMEARYNQRA